MSSLASLICVSNLFKGTGGYKVFALSADACHTGGQAFVVHHKDSDMSFIHNQLSLGIFSTLFILIITENTKSKILHLHCIKMF